MVLLTQRKGRNIQLHGADKASATGNRLLKDTLLYGAGFEGADTVVSHQSRTLKDHP